MLETGEDGAFAQKIPPTRSSERPLLLIPTHRVKAPSVQWRMTKPLLA
jgi:hypothetical protein